MTPLQVFSKLDGQRRFVAPFLPAPLLGPQFLYGLREVAIGHLLENCPAGHLKRMSVFPDLTNQRLVSRS